MNINSEYSTVVDGKLGLQTLHKICNNNLINNLTRE